MIVGFLREFAEVESFVGNASGAQALNELADQVATSVNDLLWSAPGVGLGTNDHYVTQLNPDNTTRDFVDYDGACEVCFKANLDVDVAGKSCLHECPCCSQLDRRRPRHPGQSSSSSCAEACRSGETSSMVCVLPDVDVM